MKRKALSLLLVLLAVAVSAVLPADEVKPVKYVFLFIGDGLSIPQRMMTEEFLQRTEQRGLLINSLETQAITSTRAENSFITDSAASGTAIACGEKTNNGRIGVNADGSRKLESVAEVARDSGRKVGIISSVTLNHATPASFYGHNASRSNYYQLGLDLIDSKFDYFGGGGISNHDSVKDKMYKGDIYKLAQEAGYTVCRSMEEIRALKPGSGKVIAVGAKGALPYVIDRTEEMFTLADFTRQGIELLDNPKGFFIMVEGGAIDWLCHANDATGTLREVIDFDDAVKAAYEFAQKHPGETLIVVTGDHETGGLTLGFAGTGYASYIERLAFQKGSVGALKSRIHALGEKEEVTFDEVKPLLNEWCGFIFAQDGKREKGGMNLTENEEEALERAFEKQFPEGKLDKKSGILSNEAVRILNNKAGVAWTTGAHSALPVSTTAYGKEAKLFSNMMDNTDIAKRLKLLVR